ncbi:hypothetical protein [Achromobacter phage kwar_LB4]|nr:hypothetical protein [Achromobacter phage kwar_LB4]
MSYAYEDDEDTHPQASAPNPNSFETKLLNQQKEVFLENLAMNGNVTLAARAAGWKYPTIAERYRAEDEQFAEAWVDALTQATDAMEYEARRRAMEGWDEPVWYMGEQVGSVLSRGRESWKTRFCSLRTRITYPTSAQQPETPKSCARGCTATGILYPAVHSMMCGKLRSMLSHAPKFRPLGMFSVLLTGELVVLSLLAGGQSPTVRTSHYVTEQYGARPAGPLCVSPSGMGRKNSVLTKAFICPPEKWHGVLPNVRNNSRSKDGFQVRSRFGPGLLITV